MTRRDLLFAAGSCLLSSCASRVQPAENIDVADFNAAGALVGVHRKSRLVLSDAEWRARLTLTQFYSTRKGSTDTPFTGTLFREHRAGLFRCIGCATALFHSAAKFDSGTGWPSFLQPVDPRNIRTRTDTTIEPERTEVLCALCDAHLGHVFDDGPAPTGLRYCVNESALQFELA